MTRFILHAARALTPHEEIRDAAVWVEDGAIRAFGPRGSFTAPPGLHEIRVPDCTLVPGFVDVHIHGAGGHDVMEASAEALSTVAATLARHGTTSFVATTVTSSPDALCRSAAEIARCMGAQVCAAGKVPRAEILGIHFEGPFLSHARRGVHPADWIAAPALPLLDRMLEAASGTARILTLAPELPGALELIRRARVAGLVVSLGHTDATFEQASAAIDVGASHAAHVFNAMRPFSHRDTGVLGAVLTSPEVTCELIADGVHVDSAAMRLLLAAKGAPRTVLVSDGTAATGMPDGKYRLGTLEVTVSGGVCRNAEGKLAGSTLTLDRALRTVVGLGAPLGEALAMLTMNPARLLGLDGKKGALAEGADADFVLLDSDLQVKGVVTRGVCSAGL